MGGFIEQFAEAERQAYRGLLKNARLLGGEVSLGISLPIGQTGRGQALQDLLVMVPAPWDAPLVGRLPNVGNPAYEHTLDCGR